MVIPLTCWLIYDFEYQSSKGRLKSMNWKLKILLPCLWFNWYFTKELERLVIYLFFSLGVIDGGE